MPSCTHSPDIVKGIGLTKGLIAHKQRTLPGQCPHKEVVLFSEVLNPPSVSVVERSNIQSQCT